ncbi:hypothetical protein A1O7_01976 [Cladophialophora yegresii CBS 114405]|uniref:Uncharacterized protein n=1 Tax=Cladophialophora yegresii CBS 114405 TaxID=1182544 RepID=W9W0T3_9EURO|nr:uncharacterized protein A1O7_01976 [Cladophialophora yegresii CBS 114405]EXJ61548.1 hypothetical protein A1O7_01976 [Cladophialophora yegresii CBS 114405]
MPRPAEVLPTINGDEERDETDGRRISLDLAMIDYDFHPSRTPSWSVADWALPEDQSFPRLTADVVSNTSRGAKPPENHLEHIDKQLHFVSRFQKLAEQRRKVRRLRVRARDGRGQIQATRHRLHGALQRVLKAIEAHSVRSDSENSLMKDLETAEMVCDELNSEDIVQDIVESDLLPEEWELEDSERRLYEAVLGPSASDGDDDLDIDPGTTHQQDRRPAKANESETYLPGPDEATAEERLLALVEERRHLKESLEKQEKEYAALRKDLEMRAAAGVPIDIFSRDTLEDFGERRGAMLKHIARLSTQISELEAMSSEASRHDSRQSNALFGLHQFHDLETGKYTQAPENGDCQILRLYDEDYRARNADMDSFLGQTVLEQLERVDSLQEQESVPAIVPHLAVKWAVDDELVDDLTNYVSHWILGCIQASWWSFARLAAWVDTAGEFTIQRTAELLKATWFVDGAGLSSPFVWSEDPRSSIVPQPYMDLMLTPTSGTVGMREPLWQVDRPKRRHTSGYSDRKTHQRRVSSHSHPGTGRVQQDPPVPSDSVSLAS